MVTCPVIGPAETFKGIAVHRLDVQLAELMINIWEEWPGQSPRDIKRFSKLRII